MSRRVWVPVVSGPLAPYAEGYGRWLSARGYSPSAATCRIWQLAGLSAWLEGEGLDAGALTPERVERFLAARRAAGLVTWVSPLGMRVPLAFLREAGVATVPICSAVDGPVEELIGRYREFLARERGLARGTIVHCERVARLFLSQWERDGRLELERLSAAQVTEFVTSECPKRTVSGARDLVTRLRPLLRYLHLVGLTEDALQSAVPGVAHMRHRGLPRALEPASVGRLLASCDRSAVGGCRDFAILLLLSRLGLRAGEVAALQLDDIDWRGGEIVIHGKGLRRERLPLPVDVGEALVCYLRDRPHSESRALFLCDKAPYARVSTFVVSAVVRRACRRAGLPSAGPHRLRHTAATGMLRAGASLGEIAEVLRHRDLKTTAIYAKVDHAALRALAQPWPGGLA